MGKLWHQGREGPGEDVWRDGWLLQEELAMVDFICVDGVAREANYSTTEDDVVKEKKMLSKFIACGSTAALCVFYDQRGYVCRQLGNAYGTLAPCRTAAVSAREYNGLTQVAHSGNWPKGRMMRSQLRAFLLTKDIYVAKGKAAANSNLGKGGGTQYFVSDQDKNSLVGGNVLKFGS
jgi:hypothetical protein